MNLMEWNIKNNQMKMLSWKRNFTRICYPVIWVRRKYLKWHNKCFAVKDPYAYVGRFYKKYYGLDMNIEHPKTLHEKIFWMEYYSDTTEWSRLTDKVAVRDYVEECGLGYILNEVYAVYDAIPDENTFFENLPDAFVAKVNNSGGGTAILVKNKEHCNKKGVMKQLVDYFYDDYGARTGQPHYSCIKPKILVEKLLVNDKEPQAGLVDYKFFCFNGEPKYVNVIGNRDLFSHSFLIDQVFDLNWERIVFDKKDKSKDIECPCSFKEMISIAKILSASFSFVRVDLYEVGGKPVFGELTFTPGIDKFCFYQHEYLHYEDLIDLSKIKKI